MDNSQTDLSNIRIIAKNGKIIVAGSAPDFKSLQAVDNYLRTIPGAPPIENKIKIIY